jgi:hypothetical protein
MSMSGHISGSKDRMNPMINFRCGLANLPAKTFVCLQHKFTSYTMGYAGSNFSGEFGKKKTSLRKHDSDYSEDPQLFCSFEGLLTCFAFRLKTRSCLPITLQHFFNFLVICSGWRLLIERSQACVVNAKPAMLRKTLDSDALPYQAKASRPIHFTCSTENQRYPA